MPEESDYLYCTTDYGYTYAGFGSLPSQVHRLLLFGWGVVSKLFHLCRAHTHFLYSCTKVLGLQEKFEATFRTSRIQQYFDRDVEMSSVRDPSVMDVLKTRIPPPRHR